MNNEEPYTRKEILTLAMYFFGSTAIFVIIYQALFVMYEKRIHNRNP